MLQCSHMRVPVRQSEVLAQSKKVADHHLTRGTMERMRQEILRLTKERPALAAEMQRTAEEGDFSENAGYQAAKAALRRLNSRITYLDEQLRFAIPINQDTDDGKVHVGSKVTIEANGKTLELEILGSQESSPGKGRISHLSPLGVALMGHSVGDEIEFETPSGKVNYKLIGLE